MSDFGNDINVASRKGVFMPTAQPEKRTEERTETPACDLILQTLKDAQPEWLPPADTDLSAYIDKVWRTAYERGKREAEAERKRGKWINDEHDMPRCSCCGYMPEYNRHIDDYYYSDWCPNCGAEMRGDNNEN